MVQFARRTDGTGTALCALKFFAKRSCYDEEVGIYRSAPVQLQRFMPAVVKYSDNCDGALRCPFGNVLPPCIVMEKGESLKDRASNMPVDLYTAAQVCFYLVRLLSVHRSVAQCHIHPLGHRGTRMYRDCAP